jgi:hypothetical protein
MATAEPLGPDGTLPGAKSGDRTNDVPSRDREEFPIALIPLVVPLFAVLLAVCTYFILGSVL